VAVDEPPAVRADVGVLVGVEPAVGGGQEAVEVAGDAARHGERRRIAAQRVAARVGLEVARLVGDQLLEVRLGPVAADRVLVDAAPHRIDDRALAVEGPGDARGGPGVAVRGAPELEHRVVADRRLDPEPPAAVLVVVEPVEVADRPRGDPRQRLGARRGCDHRGARLGAGGAGEGLGEDLAQPLGRQVAAELAELLGVGRQQDRRRPAPVAVALGEVGPLVDVDPDRDEVRAQRLADLGVAIGGLVHHVAPVAPRRRAVDEDEAVLAGGAGERRGRPRLPGEALRGAPGAGRGDVDARVGRGRGGGRRRGDRVGTCAHHGEQGGEGRAVHGPGTSDPAIRIRGSSRPWAPRRRDPRARTERVAARGDQVERAIPRNRWMDRRSAGGGGGDRAERARFRGIMGAAAATGPDQLAP
jgi:hypothetical protein